MLKNIPSILTPELLKALMEMGHGDEILIADGNYPKFGQPENVIHLDGHDIPEIMTAILKFMPLDSYVDFPVTYMKVLPDDPFVPTIWETYDQIVQESEMKKINAEKINKHEFYERGKKTYVVVKTGEKELYANVILKKGVI